MPNKMIKSSLKEKEKSAIIELLERRSIDNKFLFSLS